MYKIDLKKPLSFIALIAAFVFTVNLTRAEAEEPIVLKALTPWPMTYYWSEPMAIFERMVAERLDGKVEVRYIGAGEVTPPFEQFEALRNGVVDVILGASSYYTGQVPEASAVLYTKLSASQLRENGFYDLMRKVHRDKGGVVYLSNSGGAPGTAFRFFVNEELEGMDFSGLRIRVTPVYADLVKALGGTPITTKPSELYTALDRGIVDGYGWSYGGITDFAWQEVTKSVINQPFYTANTAILLNAQVWDSLPEDIRIELEAIGAELEGIAEEKMSRYNATEDENLKELGLTFIDLSPEDAEYFTQTAYKTGWDQFIAAHPNIGPRLRELSE
nr:TRAP transporter substrate-binding protein DctP [uncultured Roseovarius sp.]